MPVPRQRPGDGRYTGWCGAGGCRMGKTAPPGLCLRQRADGAAARRRRPPPRTNARARERCVICSSDGRFMRERRPLLRQAGAGGARAAAVRDAVARV